MVTELDGKIPVTYHTYLYPEKILCLGTAVELYQIFTQKPCLSNFIDNILNPYLYRWLFIEKFGKAPWEDRSHGLKGIIEAYSSILQIPLNLTMIVEFLNLLIRQETRSNSLCPCNSGKKVKCCHKKKLEKLLKTVPLFILRNDLKLLWEILNENH